MKAPDSSWFRVSIRISTLIALAAPIFSPTALPQDTQPAHRTESEQGFQQSKEMRFRGRIVCLGEEMQRLYKSQLPTPHEHLYGFKTGDGMLYTLLRTRTSEALFSDKQLHKLELIVQGRVLPNSLILDAIPVGSIHDGKVYDLYYWCTVCAIRTPIPGDCMCCQQPVEFVEKPSEK
jgi:hypothetical protein